MLDSVFQIVPFILAGSFISFVWNFKIRRLCKELLKRQGQIVDLERRMDHLRLEVVTQFQNQHNLLKPICDYLQEMDQDTIQLDRRLIALEALRPHGSIAPQAPRRRGRPPKQ